MGGGTPRPPWLYEITERQWLALDAATAVVVFLSTGLSLRAQFAHKSGAGFALVLVCCLGMAVRRRWPLPAMAVVTLSFAGLTTLGSTPLALSVALALAGYMVAARAPRALSIPALVVALVALAIALGIGGRGGAVGQEAIQSLLVLAAAWFVGDSVSARRAYIASATEQELVAESIRARQAVREERVRIARELHDVVAHSLAVITVQAGVGRRLMGKRPEQAGAALESIESTGRTAQDELRVVLGLLRDDDAEQAELMPAPRLADLKELIETIRAAGTPVSLHASGADRRLSPALELSVYRIIQEALTNVVKHAQGARATVDLDISARGISIEVTDDGGFGHGGDGGARVDRGLSGCKNGIVGMHERVGAFGGTLVAKLVPGHGFRVVAHIPLQPLEGQ
jgi:signal transduction histidine kinase